MARARGIKPAITRNEDLAELEPIYRLGFIYSWMFADVNGVIEYRPKRLKMDIFPYDDVSIDEWIGSLALKGFVVLFSVDSKRYFKVVNFVKHQNPHKKEREAGSELPESDHPQAVVIETVDAVRNWFGTSTAPSVLIPDSPFLIPDSLNTDTEIEISEPLPKQIESPRSACREVFENWQKVLNHPKAVMDKRRTTILRERLKDFTLEQLLMVPHGVKNSPYHNGANPDGKQYHEIKTVFRDADQVEKFIALAEQKPQKENETGFRMTWELLCQTQYPESGTPEEYAEMKANWISNGYEKGTEIEDYERTHDYRERFGEKVEVNAGTGFDASRGLNNRQETHQVSVP